MDKLEKQVGQEIRDDFFNSKAAEVWRQRQRKIDRARASGAVESEAIRQLQHYERNTPDHVKTILNYDIDHFLLETSEKRRPKWSKWSHIPRVKLWEAVALSLDIEPSVITREKDGWMASKVVYAEGPDFDDRMLIAERNLDHAIKLKSIVMGNPQECEVDTSQFAEWAASINWDIPEALRAKIPTPIEEPVATPSTTYEKPLSTRERNNYLLIIAALAKGAKIDVTVEPYTAANKIIALGEQIGFQLKQETVATKLKLVNAAIIDNQAK
ncbi:hypothetical protein [Robbsia andropogonis]|uniref:hypothetical protein n=1 Tax=Robbsia andropogonis TaxID=28092 RepID=UPI002A6B2768|nr:hypothetical protein [Robbsia andropogonis]